MQIRSDRLLPDATANRTMSRDKKKGKKPNLESFRLPLLDPASSSTASALRQGSVAFSVSPLTPRDTISLLQQYKKLVGQSGGLDLPHLHLPSKTEGQPAARNRFTTRSMARVERADTKLFTEGLSSISKHKEPSFAMHRRDIIGANMPETVKVARERSKLTIGVSHCRPQKQTVSKPNRHKRFKYSKMKPGAVTANEIMAPLVVPQKVELGNVWEENTHKRESRIVMMLRRLEERYGKEMVHHDAPDTPSGHTLEYSFSSTSATPSINTPRRTPRTVDDKPVKPNLSVVSVGDALADLPQKPKPKVTIVRPKDQVFNDFERYRQHAYEKKQSCAHVNYGIGANRPGLQYPYVGEVSSFFKYKAKPKPKAQKRQIIVSLKDLTGPDETDDDSLAEQQADDDVAKFRVDGVKGVGTGLRLWSPCSISTCNSVVNPPPSAEAGLFNIEFPHIPDPAKMFPLDEEENTSTKPEVLLCEQTDVRSLDGSQIPKPRSEAAVSSKSNNSFLSVPSVITGKESLPTAAAPWGERPPQREDACSDEFHARLIQDAVAKDDGSLEVLSGCSGPVPYPAISISDSEEPHPALTTDQQPHDNLSPDISVEEMDADPIPETDIGLGPGIELDSNKSPNGNGSAKIKSPVTPVHNQNIMFISPLEFTGNAKRQ